MPGTVNASLKDPELYERLRSDGSSPAKAARISNAAAKERRSVVGARGGRSEPYEEWTIPEVRKRSRELGLAGLSRSRKAVLIAALRED